MESPRPAYVDEKLERKTSRATCVAFAPEDKREYSDEKIEYIISNEAFAYGRHAEAYRAVVYTDKDDKPIYCIAKKYKDEESALSSLHMYNALKTALNKARLETDSDLLPSKNILPLFYFAIDGDRNIVFTEDLGGENGITISTMNKHFEDEDRNLSSITNFDELLSEIIKCARFGRNYGFVLPEDAYFLSFDKAGGDTDVKLWIGDFYDQIKHYGMSIDSSGRVERFKDEVSATSINLTDAKIVISSFVDRYVTGDKKEEYLKKIEDAFTKAKSEQDKMDEKINFID